MAAPREATDAGMMTGEAQLRQAVCDVPYLAMSFLYVLLAVGDIILRVELQLSTSTIHDHKQCGSREGVHQTQKIVDHVA
ncbi:hypothetical protein [Streptomyces capitiformicae]|uniref:Uncharacterized protein n=1 Tax=Streptomyces capitiformicae TaxID=2014920 RepID=A0A918Z2X1_9ACTN|nr:hypothetical protein [Streptomyces capitiformicae]GHE34731.1 hypothetical protein GCM10017771_52490 [Streptomyces capitiformicae]